MKKLRLQYESCCKEYQRLFCEFLEVEPTDSFWVADQIGGMLDIAMTWDVSMDDIKYVVDSLDEDDVNVEGNLFVATKEDAHGVLKRVPVTKEEFIEWYDYNTLIYDIDTIPSINIHSWHIGCPRLSPEQLDEVDTMRNTLNNMAISFDADDTQGQEAIAAFKFYVSRRCEDLYKECSQPIRSKIM